MAKQKESVKLVDPFIKSVNQGVNSDTLLVVIEPVKGAKALNYQIAKYPITDTTEWETYSDTRPKLLICQPGIRAKVMLKGNSDWQQWAYGTKYGSVAVLNAAYHGSSKSGFLQFYYI